MEKDLNIDIYVRPQDRADYEEGWDQTTPQEAEQLLNLDDVELKLAFLVEPTIGNTGPMHVWRGIPTLPTRLTRSTVSIMAGRATRYLSVGDYTKISTFDNLKHLSLVGNHQVRLGRAAISAVAALSNLEAIDLTSSRGRFSEMCSILPPSLKHLKVRNTRFSDKTILALPCENLESLEIEQTPVTSTGVRSLKRFGNLKKLRVSAKRINFEDLAELSSLEDLELIDFQTDRADFGRFPKLTSLSVSNCTFNDGWLDSLNPDKLLSLCIGQTPTVRANQIDRFVNLEEIGLDDDSFVNEVLSRMVRHGNLKRVYASDSSITDEAARTVLESEAIEDANFNFTGLTDACLSFHPKSRLMDLQLAGTTVSDVGVKEIAKLRRLSVLDLMYTQITDESCRYLSSVSTLRRVLLDSGGITDQGAEYLKSLRHLELLIFSGPGFTDIGLASFKGLDRLRFFVFAGSSVTKAGAEKLQASLPYCIMSF